MVTDAADPPDERSASGASSDEGDVGWGGRDWSDGTRDDGEDPDVERLRAERPPHHEERDR